MRKHTTTARTMAIVALVAIAAVATGCRKATNMVEADAAKRGERVVALTFDDGPGQFTPQLLDVLAAHDVKATFFVQGSEAERHPDIIDRIVAEGHHIGNHTWSHLKLTGESDASVAAQLRSTAGWLNQRGISIKCVRPPYGATNARIEKLIRAHANNAYTMLWSIDPRDWEGPAADVIDARIMAKLNPGAVIILHDGGENGADRSQTVEAVDRLIPQIIAAGYSIRPVC